MLVFLASLEVDIGFQALEGEKGDSIHLFSVALRVTVQVVNDCATWQ